MSKEGWGEQGGIGRNERWRGLRRRRKAEAQQKKKNTRKRTEAENTANRKKEKSCPSFDHVFPHSTHHLLAYCIIYLLCRSPIPQKNGRYGRAGTFCLPCAWMQAQNRPGLWEGFNVYLLNE